MFCKITIIFTNQRPMRNYLRYPLRFVCTNFGINFHYRTKYLLYIYYTSSTHLTLFGLHIFFFLFSLLRRSKKLKTKRLLITATIVKPCHAYTFYKNQSEGRCSFFGPTFFQFQTLTPSKYIPFCFEDLFYLFMY